MTNNQNKIYKARHRFSSDVMLVSFGTQPKGTITCYKGDGRSETYIGYGKDRQEALADLFNTVLGTIPKTTREDVIYE